MPEEVERYLYIFKNSDMIWDGISYDEETLSNTIPFIKSMKMACSSSMDVLEAIVAKGSLDRIYLSDTHCIAGGYSSQYPVYRKLLTSSENKGLNVEFIVEKCNYNNKWDVLLQTPFVRLAVSGGYTSEKRAVSAIRSLIKAQGSERMLRLGEIFQKYEKACHAKNPQREKSNFVDTLDSEWELKPWYVIGNYSKWNEAYLSPKWIKCQIYRR